MRLLVATHNSHKTEEIRAMLPADWQIDDLTSQPGLVPPEETGATFAENAAIKALAASIHFPGLVLADDSALEVDALQGAPGVRSARYAGVGAKDGENRAQLRRELAATGRPGPWPARFRCVMALASGGRLHATFEGEVEGAIIAEEQGSGGFGYDSLFVPEGYGQTFGELPPKVKNRLSHRARALASARESLATFSA